MVALERVALLGAVHRHDDDAAVTLDDAVLGGEGTGSQAWRGSATGTEQRRRRRRGGGSRTTSSVRVVVVGVDQHGVDPAARAPATSAAGVSPTCRARSGATPTASSARRKIAGSGLRHAHDARVEDGADLDAGAGPDLADAVVAQLRLDGAVGVGHDRDAGPGGRDARAARRGRRGSRGSTRRRGRTPRAGRSGRGRGARRARRGPWRRPRL